MRKLDDNHFPIVSTYPLAFKLTDGRTLIGKYDFNKNMQRRWIDASGNEYTSESVEEWEAL